MMWTSTSAFAGTPPVVADDDGTRRRPGSELLRELFGEDAADHDRPDTSSARSPREG